jgi:hypothetical protein
MKPSEAHLAQLTELVNHCTVFAEELSALDRTIKQYAWSLEQEQTELTLLGNRITSLEIAAFTQKATSTEAVAC